MKVNELIKLLPTYNYEQLKRTQRGLLNKFRETKNETYQKVLKIVIKEMKTRDEFLLDEDFQEKNTVERTKIKQSKYEERTRYNHKFDLKVCHLGGNRDYHLGNRLGLTSSDLYNKKGVFSIESPEGKVYYSYSDKSVMRQLLDVVNALNIGNAKKASKKLFEDWKKFNGEKEFKVTVIEVGEDISCSEVRNKLVKEAIESGIEVYNKIL